MVIVDVVGAKLVIVEKIMALMSVGINPVLLYRLVFRKCLLWRRLYVCGLDHSNLANSFSSFFPVMLTLPLSQHLKIRTRIRAPQALMRMVGKVQYRTAQVGSAASDWHRLLPLVPVLGVERQPILRSAHLHLPLQPASIETTRPHFSDGPIQISRIMETTTSHLLRQRTAHLLAI